MQLGPMADAGRVVDEAGIARQLREVERLAQRAEHSVIADRQVEEAIGGPEAAVGGDHRDVLDTMRLSGRGSASIA